MLHRQLMSAGGRSTLARRHCPQVLRRRWQSADPNRITARPLWTSLDHAHEWYADKKATLNTYFGELRIGRCIGRGRR